MTQLNERVIHIHTNDFESLYKHLLLQPITFKVQRTEEGCAVSISDEMTTEGVKYLVEQLTNTVHEEITTKGITEAFVEQGVYKEWPSARLVPRLSLDELDTPWRKDIQKDMKKYVKEALENNKPIKLNAYLMFGTSKAKESAKAFGVQLEETAFYGVVERSLSALEIENIPEHEVLSESSIELVGEPTDMKFLSEPNDDGAQTEVVRTDDFIQGLANLYAEGIYHPDSKRYKEAQFYIYTLMMMKRWNVQRWLVPTSIYSTLESYRSRLDIPVMIEKKGTTN